MRILFVFCIILPVSTSLDCPEGFQERGRKPVDGICIDYDEILIRESCCIPTCPSTRIAAIFLPAGQQFCTEGYETVSHPPSGRKICCWESVCDESKNYFRFGWPKVVGVPCEEAEGIYDKDGDQCCMARCSEDEDDRGFIPQPALPHTDADGCDADHGYQLAIHQASGVHICCLAPKFHCNVEMGYAEVGSRPDPTCSESEILREGSCCTPLCPSGIAGVISDGGECGDGMEKVVHEDSGRDICCFHEDY